MRETTMNDVILELLRKKIAQSTLSDEEHALLEQWADASPHFRELLERAGNDALLMADLTERHALDKTQAWSKVAARIGVEEPRLAPVRPMFLRSRWWVAAALVVIMAGATYFALYQKENNKGAIVRKEVIDVPPGHEGAVLTLADGSKVSLDSNSNMVVALQGGVTAKVVNGVLRYEGDGNEVVYNTMSTPRGRKFSVVLPDGTMVWLNAASEIRYPSMFKGGERLVELKGEGYFEVAKNAAMPFRVSLSGKAEVEVLGTSFNVKAYTNESSIRTTLIEGSVLVRRGKEETRMRPGEQARIAENIFVSQAVDIEQVMAWKNGLFNFDGADLKEVMTQLERWYDIEVVYENEVPAATFFGKISTRNSLQQVLSILEKSEVKFRLEAGNRLVITQ